MTQKHKHAEYIIAFANGEAVQYKNKGRIGGWCDVDCLSLFEDSSYVFRMKPKKVTTKGYKRFAFQDPTSGEWVVDTYTDGCTYSLAGGEVWIDKEWQYAVIEGEGCVDIVDGGGV